MKAEEFDKERALCNRCAYDRTGDDNLDAGCGFNAEDLMD
jgi:hypothetical protein